MLSHPDYYIIFNMLNSAAAFPTRTQMLVVDTGNVNALHTSNTKHVETTVRHKEGSISRTASI